LRLIAASSVVRAAAIDGELVCAADDGISDFSRLHSRCFDYQAFLYGFDLLELNGEDHRLRSLVERKEMLAKLLRGLSPGDSFLWT
jgi:bifunctional non-homologous end joining protein LigD